MSTLGDAPLNRKRKRKNTAQAEAEAARITPQATKIERATAIPSMIPVAVQTVIPSASVNPLRALSELSRAISEVAWLRIVPKHDDGITHWYIKYNQGKWNGYYIYYAQDFGADELDAIEFLITRFSEVEAGVRRPHKDTRYSG